MVKIENSNIIANENLENNNLTSNEKIILQDIINSWVNIKEVNIEVKELENWIIAVKSKWTLHSYRKVVNWEVENYLNIKNWLKKNKLFSDMLRYTWYEFVWEKLYKQEDLKNWVANPEAKEIDMNSLEYFKVMDNTYFFDWCFYKNEYVRRSRTWEGEFDEKTISNLVNYRNIRLKDFLYFKQVWRINDEMYKKYLPIVKWNLLEQCADTRYDVFEWEDLFYSVDISGKELKAASKAETDVKENEIKFYFENWYIDAKIAKKALEIIKLKEEREKWRDNIKRQGIKSRNEIFK